MSEQAETPATGSVTTGRGRAGIWRRGLLLGALCLVVLATLGTGGWYLWAHTSLLHKTTPAVVGYSKLSPAAAVTAAKAQVQAAQTPTAKAIAYNQLGEAYLSNNQASQAIQAYQSALQAVSTTPADTTRTNTQVTTLLNLATAYGQEGDKSSEISTLQQLLPLLQQDSDPAAGEIAPRVQRLIANLQAPDIPIQGAP